MARDWETTFRDWSKPSSDTEQEKCENAESMIRGAIRESKTLSGKTMEVFPQGSYRNNTNVRQDSDVDVCVRLMDVMFYDFAPNCGFDRYEVGISDASYTYAQFKNDAEAALVDKFGRKAVTRGNKALDIHANTYRVDADAVACFEYRYYTHRTSDGRFHYHSGTKFLPDKGGAVINWPNQHYDNGVVKNKATGNRFKFITRVMKRLRNEMAEQGFTVAEPIASFLIESLTWNVPNEGFSHDQYTDDVRYVLAHTFNETMTDDKCREWCEVNGLKYLFGLHQPWTREQANNFLLAAWRYIGFS